MDDIRLSVTLPSHPKTTKLIRRVGPCGGWNLVCLLIWAAQNKPDGCLRGMSDEDIEIAALWAGEVGAFVTALAGVRFLDGTTGEYQLHDWAEHQPWASGADLRSAKARWNAVKRHHGERTADAEVPEWAARRKLSATPNDAISTATSTATEHASSTYTAMHAAQPSNAPSPSPSPSPSPKALHDSLRSSAPAAPSFVGSEATAADEPLKRLWLSGVALLTGAGEKEPSARKILGKLRRQHGDVAVLEALVAAESEHPSSPVDWLMKTVPERASRAKPINGSHPPRSTVPTLPLDIYGDDHA